MTTLTTSNVSTEVRQEFILPIDQVQHLQRLAARHHISENELVTKALAIFLELADLFEEDSERRGWYRLAEPSLLRIWDNEGDAMYDNWRKLYDVPEG